MPSNPFEAALSQPESDLPHAQLVTLLSVGEFSDPYLPTIAENYLSAFCDPSRSEVQRRWIGITLARMLEKSDRVAHLLRLSDQLKKLGVIIVSHEEQGVIKTIAGLIMRQGLEQDIEYHKFWPTEKLAHSALDFPRRPDSRWMSDFHTFLNCFDESTISNLSNQSYIGYIASMATSDGFTCGEPVNDICAVILETGMLAIIVSDIHLENCHFVDISVSHIISTRSESSRPHDVQTRPTGCESCSVILSLKSIPWAYCLNSRQRIATEISLLFKRSKDAVQWEDYIKRHQKAHEAHRRISDISVDTNPLPSWQDRQQKSPCGRPSHCLADQSSLQKPSKLCHDSLSYARPRRTRSHTSLQEENKSLSSQCRHVECSKERQTHASRAAKQNALKKLGLQSGNVDGYDQKERGQQQTDSDAPSTGSSSKGKEVTKSGNVHIGHTVKDDEEHPPTQKRSKKRASTKRKAGLQLAKNGDHMKRSRVHTDSHADLTITAKIERDRPQIPAKPFSSALFSRHSLIEGLEGSQELADSDASFKKPTLPAPSARYPSTPTKPKQQVLETQRRLQISRVPRSFDVDIFSQMPSSPPIPYQPNEGMGWSRETATEAAILSSNSKPVPASPNAESTAISGHADNDDVAFEKRTGDSQIARSDPFTRRSKGGKITSFLRRLTGEEPIDVASNLGTDDSQIALAGNIDSSPARLDGAVIEPLPQPRSGRKKTNHPALAGTQEIDGGHGVENGILNGGIWYDEQRSSESDLTPVYFSSSPPRLGSLTSHSSTSATPLLSPHSALFSSDVNEICRETSPEPFQRN
ncbi:uncharacterized protein yc1106_02641 [Curvularia clavata]|uniref:Uncharacterized protein n=1 Tax=Curvularia clavata TaxID=95742 RepID=A0A9Q9DQ94_CURCL|nr:uncharacterized protein yc1106_02641 [Curvularia clavata]